MKPRILLFALACLTLAAAPALALTFRGMPVSSHGSAVVDTDASGRLRVSNIGSSGQDGVSIDLQHSSGVRLSLDGFSSSSTDVGSSVSLDFTCTSNGLVWSPRSNFAVLADRCVCTPSWSGMCASSSSQECLLTSEGRPTGRRSMSSGSSVDVMMDALGRCPKPVLSVYFDRDSHVMRMSYGFSSSVTVVVDGTLYVCDGITFTCALDPEDYNCDGSSGEMRVVATQASNYRVCTCPDGYVRVLDHFVSGTGSAVLSLQASTLTPGTLYTARRLPVHNIGSSGQDGVEIARAPECMDEESTSPTGGAAVYTRCAPPSLYFDPSSDDGASCRISVVGHGFTATGSPLGTCTASLVLTVIGNQFYCVPSHTGSGSDEEWFAVFSHGVEVGRSVMTPGSHHILVTSPPNEPLGMAINEKGLPGEKKPMPTKQASSSHLAQPVIEGGASYGSRGQATGRRMHTMVSFTSSKIFLYGGQAFTGDAMCSWTECTDGGCEGSVVVDRYSEQYTCSSSGTSCPNADLMAIGSSGGDHIGPDVSGVSLTSSSTCAVVPFVFTRVDSTPARAYSVTFHLSPELAMCSPVVESDYLSRVSDTQFYVTDNGGGSYTVDGSILGTTCGVKDAGELFRVSVSSTVSSSSSMGTITVDEVLARDCSNHPIPASAGDVGVIPISNVRPPALSSLTATQVKQNNPPNTRISAITLRFPKLTSVGSEVMLYAKPYGNYPRYDDGSSPGSVPSLPSSSSNASSSGWRRCTCPAGSYVCTSSVCDATGTCSTEFTDYPPSRDFYYYVAFVRDQYGNESPVSSMTTGTLDYHLGDVTEGSSMCTGDNHVTLADISALGSHYGTRINPNDTWDCLDVGPTTDFSVDALPTTDGRIQFEDLMMFAINYLSVSAPQAANRPAALAANASALELPETLPGVGETFDAGVVVDGAGNVQGMSVQLAYDHAMLEQVGVAAGELMDRQASQGLVLSSAPGNVDAALLGTSAGFAGHGTLATVTFRVKAAGDPGLAIASVSARDANNRPIAIDGTPGATVPARTSLGFAYPNPFGQTVAFQLGLRASGPANIGVYDVAGRRVRTLVHGFQPAGARVVTWDGRDDAGLRMAPGAYIVRLEAGGIRESRTVRLVR